MSGVAFLLIVVVIGVVGSLVLWLRTRKPTTFMSSVEDFQREMEALGREPTPPSTSRRSNRGRKAAPPPTRKPPATPPSRRGRPPAPRDQVQDG
jgi:hypothetical protein